MPTEAPNKQILTTNDLEAALRLLTAEEGTNGSTRKLAITFITDVLVGVVIFGGLSGILTLRYRISWGLLILGLAIVTFITMGALASSPDEVSKTTKKIRKVLEATEFGKTARQGWQNRELTSSIIITFLLMVVSVVFVGIGSFGGNSAMLLISLLAGLLSAMICGALFGIDDYREFGYYSQVSQLRGRMEQSLKAGGTDTDVSLSANDIKLLSEAETKQVNLTVVKGLENYNDQPASYSVAISPNVLEYIGTLARDERTKLREFLDSLQTNPRPNIAHLNNRSDPGSEIVGELAISDGKHLINYSVDDARLRVDVTDIIKKEPRGTNHAS